MYSVFNMKILQGRIFLESSFCLEMSFSKTYKSKFFRAGLSFSSNDILDWYFFHDKGNNFQSLKWNLRKPVCLHSFREVRKFMNAVIVLMLDILWSKTNVKQLRILEGGYVFF